MSTVADVSGTRVLRAVLCASACLVPGAVAATAAPSWYPYSAAAWAATVDGADPKCQEGHMQSPIDFPQCLEVETRPPLQASWGTHDVVLKNNGHTVQLDVPATAGKFAIDAHEYQLRQCHFHTGSEHTVGGRQLDMVAHCVHVKTAGPMANQRFGVLGIFFEASDTESDAFLAQFVDHLPANPDGSHRRLSTVGADTVSSFTGPVDFGLLSGTAPITEYYSYNGSLTTPPCSEVVDWYVPIHRHKVSREQLAKFTVAIGVVGGNYRPPQGLHDRSVAGCRSVAKPWYPYDAKVWANEVHGANPLCQDGHMQSPIDLPQCLEVEARPPIQVSWGKHDVVLKNNGHTVQLDVPATAGKFNIGANEYQLRQCHFHTGSEHTV
eukprot:CAMPEP_0176093696 /NCGR_PEP_ID=MMETSP0120_2-20121206/46949_1 /TAXON_ID=160619 /ORGANISM="Kryptoperidinium foliaceum, Strain CCMP 1326" /LENGTH=379 /DNA_ID=CAMNT_0017427631 /DNA_START=78 /DNA_END=1213 /DNA_ORIENTATION=+